MGPPSQKKRVNESEKGSSIEKKEAAIRSTGLQLLERSEDQKIRG